MSIRTERISELVKKYAAEFLSREADKSSIITVTNADISDDLKNATIFFSVYPEASEDVALNFAKRKRSEFKRFVKDKIRMKRIPFFDFELDLGEKNRRKIDELSNKSR
jgi:ribosome-binding factor A